MDSAASRASGGLWAAVIYANEIDPIACAALRHCGIASIVDERSIKLVGPDDVRPFRRAHFFAGAGLWEVACRLAGWPDDLPLWTASCPCQPFSVAGKGLGADDARHLWPDLFRLIDACRPACIVGEQVAGKAGDAWLDGVCADLEGIGYAVRAVEVPASAVDSPQKRSRNWWVAVGNAASHGQRPGPIKQREDIGGRVELVGAESRLDTIDGANFGPMASANGGDASAERLQRCGEQRFQPQAGNDPWTARDGQRAEGPMGSSNGEGLAIRSLAEDERGAVWNEGTPPGAANAGSFWRDAEWLQCADRKARRTKPGLRLLVDGMAGRTDLWRLAGNSIVPHVAAEVLKAILEAE